MEVKEKEPSRMVHFRIKTELYEEAERVAKKKGVPVATIMKMALSKYLTD